jgi:hypothetical protein
MDTDKSPPKDKLPAELLAATTVVSGVDSDIFIFGGFPRVDFDTALAEARRRWELALKFDSALRWWSPGCPETPCELVKAHGVNDPEAAEEAWLEAVWLWPDDIDQENAAEKFWSMHEKVAIAQARVADLRRTRCPRCRPRTSRNGFQDIAISRQEVLCRSPAGSDSIGGISSEDGNRGCWYRQTHGFGIFRSE